MRPAALGDRGKSMASEDVSSRDYGRWVLFAICYGLLWLVFIAAVFPVLHLDYDLLQTEFRRWSWAIFISPSAYVFFGALIDTAAAPVWMLLLVPAFFSKQSDGEVNPTYKRRYAWTFLVIAGIFVIEIVNLTIMWGSFPLGVDAQHYIRLRMIPFIPWPDGGFLVFP
jgi:hypothetical protein